MSRSVRTDYEALREAQARAQESIVTAPAERIGEKVGYAVMQLDRFGLWSNASGVTFGEISRAVATIDDFERHDDHPATYAVARLELVMISRPDERPAA